MMFNQRQFISICLATLFFFTTTMAATKFCYFGFGSNMLAKRIHIQNPTAVRVGAGKLENYRLDFNAIRESSFWKGAPATIVPTPDAQVYGAIWEIDMSDLESLDNQEGVREGIYAAIEVPVIKLSGDIVTCRAYHLINQPTQDLKQFDRASIPRERQPSKSYLKTIVKGAIETGIPNDYVEWLQRIKHNNITVQTMEELLELQTPELLKDVTQ